MEVAAEEEEQVLDVWESVDAEVVVSRAAAEARVVRPRVARVVRSVGGCIFF